MLPGLSKKQKRLLGLRQTLFSQPRGFAIGFIRTSIGLDILLELEEHYGRLRIGKVTAVKKHIYS